MERLEGTFFSHDGLEIFFQKWASTHAEKQLVITHGLGEHSDCYHELATELVKDGWNVYAWDLRGHGKSEGKRGFINSFEDITSDLEQFTHHLKANEFSNNKAFSLLGHSLGGLITLTTLIEKGSLGADMVIASSPALGIKVEVSVIKKKAAKFLAGFAPKITLPNEIKYQDLHTDPIRLKSYENDPLRHDKISPRLYLGMIRSMKLVQHKAAEIQIPCLFQLAGKDRIVDTASAEAVFKSIGSQYKKVYVYPDSLHEIYNDLERERVISDLKQFLKSGGHS